MKYLSIQDVARAISKKNERKTQCFDRILLQISSRIRQCVDINMFSCLYEVPEYVLGFPVYNLNECLTHIIGKLKSNGFYVDYYFPRVLHISWNHPQVPKLPNNPLMLAPKVTIANQIEQHNIPTMITYQEPKSIVHEIETIPQPKIVGRDTENSNSIINNVAPTIPPTPVKKGRKPGVKNKPKARPLSEFKPSGKFVLSIT